MRKKLFCVLLFLVIACCLCGCRKETQNETQNELQNEPQYDPQRDDAGTVLLTWVVPYVKGDLKNTAYILNRMLWEDGYPFRIELCGIDVRSSYNEELKKKEFDIAWVGLSEQNVLLQDVKSGMFARLDDFLAEDDFYQKIPAMLWEGLTFPDGHYLVPGSLFQETPSVIWFDMTKCDEAKVDAFTGDLKELPGILPEGCKIVYNGGDILTYWGYDYRYGVVWREDGSFYSPFELPEFEETLRLLHTWLENGILTQDRRNKDAVAIGLGEEPCLYDNGCLKIVGPEKYYSVAYMGGSLAISSASEQKEPAWEMLKLFYTNPKYGNAYVFGKDLSGYSAEELEATREERALLDELFRGIGTGLAKVADQDIQFASHEERLEFYEKRVIKSQAPSCELPEAFYQYELRDQPVKYVTVMYAGNFEAELAKWKQEVDDMIEKATKDEP